MNVIPDCIITDATDWKQSRKAKLAIRLDPQENEDIHIKIFDDSGRFWKVILQNELPNRTLICNAILMKAPQAKPYWRIPREFSSSGQQAGPSTPSKGNLSESSPGLRVLENGTTWITPEPYIPLEELKSDSMYVLMHSCLQEIQEGIANKEAGFAEAVEAQKKTEQEAVDLSDLREEQKKRHEEDCEKMINEAIRIINKQKHLNQIALTTAATG